MKTKNVNIILQWGILRSGIKPYSFKNYYHLIKSEKRGVSPDPTFGR